MAMAIVEPQSGQSGIVNNEAKPSGNRERSARCPICTAPIDGTYRPFCSKRCADIDLGRWLNGTYAIPGTIDAEEDGIPPSATDPEAGG